MKILIEPLPVNTFHRTDIWYEEHLIEVNLDTELAEYLKLYNIKYKPTYGFQRHLERKLGK